jgi:hypothetical protein
MVNFTPEDDDVTDAAAAIISLSTEAHILYDAAVILLSIRGRQGPAKDEITPKFYHIN